MKKNQVYRIGPTDVANIYDEYQNTDAKVITINGIGINTNEDFFEACCAAFQLKPYGDPNSNDDHFPDYTLPDPFHGLAYELQFSLEHLLSPGQEVVLVLENFYDMVSLVTESAQITMFIGSVLPYYDLDQSSSATWVQETPIGQRRKFNVYLEC